ncbi:MAG: PorT family protein [Ferruginibacter sp.]|nr:PorT family protein [Chitinophagaceae bacterium]MBP6288017.1 PorT family protein [Ferruginibacter sp.]
MQHLLRRKIKILGFAIFFLPLAGVSQLREKINLPDHDEKFIRFGINLGMNRSHFSFTHHPTFLGQDSIMVVESINSTGINLAWLVNVRLSNHFDLRTFPVNLTFSEKAFEYSLPTPDRPDGEDFKTTKKVQSITLTIPIQIKFTSDRINNFKVYMMTGVKGEYDLASNAGARKAENLIKLNRFDYGAEAGLGFHFYFPMFVLTPEIKMGWGIGNLHSRDTNLKFSRAIDKINSRMISFSLTVE